MNEPQAPWIEGFTSAGGRRIPVVSTRLSPRDIAGALKVRWNIGRKHYAVPPGLYAAGAPDPQSPVLVTASYKLTFDLLRRELGGINAWIMVLDTRGINVWCAAGKGTFGTRELEQRILAVRLDEVVAHRTLILPQLGAPGVSAPQVRKDAGWHVKYGPVLARDIPAYLAAGMKKNDAMRHVPFGLAERMTIAPVELVQAWPLLAAIVAGAALFGLPFDAAWLGRALSAAVPLLGAVLAGTILFPALLPFIPFKAFALKGALLGAVWGGAAGVVLHAPWVTAAAFVLLCAPITAFLSMNFTGSSTFTCQPGAALEVRRGIIPMIASAVLGAGAGIATRLLPL
jgi:hypothetical protein